MNAEKIDLNDFEYAGEGATGQSYNHKTNPDVLLKLSNPGVPVQVIVNELELSHKVYDAGINTPKPGQFVVEKGGRYGVLYERIPNKVSVSRAIGNNPERAEEYARRFAKACKKLHSTRLPEGMFPNVKEEDLKMLADSPFFSAAEKDKVSRFIIDAPDGDTAIHGDLNFGNMIMSGDNDWFIDLGDFSCGHPLFDLGMVYLCSMVSSEEFIRETYHMSPKTAAEFWHYFVLGYWGDDANQKEIEEMIRPYAGLKVLIIERNFNFLFPEFHALLDGVTK